MIHFRRELVDCEEEAGSPRFPPRWLVQCLQSRGTEKKEMKRAGWLQEEGGNKVSSSLPSASGSSSLSVPLEAQWGGQAHERSSPSSLCPAPHPDNTAARPGPPTQPVPALLTCPARLGVHGAMHGSWQNAPCSTSTPTPPGLRAPSAGTEGAGRQHVLAATSPTKTFNHFCPPRCICLTGWQRLIFRKIKNILL